MITGARDMPWDFKVHDKALICQIRYTPTHPVHKLTIDLCLTEYRMYGIDIIACQNGAAREKPV